MIGFPVTTSGMGKRLFCHVIRQPGFSPCSRGCATPFSFVFIRVHSWLNVFYRSPRIVFTALLPEPTPQNQQLAAPPPVGPRYICHNNARYEKHSHRIKVSASGLAQDSKMFFCH